MEKVYIVTTGKFTDYDILKVFKDKATAYAFKAGWEYGKHSNEWALVEEYEVES